MTTFQGVLFVALIAMVLVWFYCIYRLKLQLLQRHPDTHENMELADVWDAMWSDDNHRPMLALLGFLLRRKYLALHDAQITRLSIFMRWFMVVYIAMFGYLAYTIVRPLPVSERTADAAAAAASLSAEDRKQAAYDLHRALKWPQAIEAYNALLRDGEDPDILFWRGTAHWKSGQFEEALRDFQRVVELDPRHLDAHRNADHLLGRKKRWDEMLALWDRYIAHQPREAEGYLWRGRAFFEMGKIDAARADTAKACGLGKAHACAMVDRLKGP